MTLVLQAKIVIDPRLVTPERLEELTMQLIFCQPILETVGQMIEQGLADWFDSQGEGSWAALADSTIADKIRHQYGDAAPLVRTGTLRSALIERDAFGHKFLVGQNSVDIGFYPDMVPYGMRLASGFGIMPARILVQVGPDMREQIVQVIQAWLGGNGVNVTLDAYST